MVATFGDWERVACELWCSMIQSLYARDLICDSDREKLQTPGVPAPARTPSQHKSTHTHAHACTLTRTRIYACTR